MTEQAIRKALKINPSPKNIHVTLEFCALRECFCIFLKPNVSYSRRWSTYLSAFIICYTKPVNGFVIWPQWNLNSIMTYSRTVMHKKMISQCTWWRETEIWHEDTLTCVVLGFAQRQG